MNSSKSINFKKHPIVADITDTIRSNLNGYPPESLIKEMLQNSDDAKASVCKFIITEKSFEIPDEIQNNKIL